MKWSPSNYGFEDRLRKVLKSWEGTPYKLGDQRKGLGVDCIRFCCGVADEMFGYIRTEIELLPQDMSMNQPSTAFATMRKLKTMYSPIGYIDIDDPLEPGDIIVAGPDNGGPGHLMFVGADKNTLWHASNQKVEWTGMSVPVGNTHFRSLRFKDKMKWLNR